MFKIVNSQGAVATHQMNKQVAKVSAREILKERASGANVAIGAEERGYVQKATGFFKYPQDNVKVAKTYKASYDRTLPETLSPETQSHMWKRAKQLKDEFTVGMLSREEMHPVKGFLDNGTMKYVVDEEKLRLNNCVTREAMWQKQNAKKIDEFKNIMRHLNPDDPNAGDVEKYRPRRGV